MSSELSNRERERKRIGDWFIVHDSFNISLTERIARICLGSAPVNILGQLSTHDVFHADPLVPWYVGVPLSIAYFGAAAAATYGLNKFKDRRFAQREPYASVDQDLRDDKIRNQTREELEHLGRMMTFGMGWGVGMGRIL